MPLIPDFKFGHRLAVKRQVAAVGLTQSHDLRGPLVNFLAPSSADDIPDQRQWRGTGFNLIWRPDHDKLNGNPNDFFLELNETVETITFQDVSGGKPGIGIANRGALQSDIQLGAISYTQQISDSNLDEDAGLHFEPGVWIAIGPTSNPKEDQPSIARMGSIPHGTTINLQGHSLPNTEDLNGLPEAGLATLFGSASITPSKIVPKFPNDESQKVQFFSAQETIDPKNPDDPSRTKISVLKRVDQAHLTNPNLFLVDACKGLKVTKVKTLKVSSDPQLRDGIPSMGGGISNIAFLEGTSAPNANATPASATFWFVEGADSEGNHFVQLQYSQRVLLKFNNLNWPHISVGRLRPV